jgi:mono/diheme cytochrome c family protein
VNARGVAVCAALLAACGGDGGTPSPEREARVAEAEAAYSTTLFDTITWASERERAVAGDLAYATHCRNCHGPTGEGDTEYARTQRVDVPSLVDGGAPGATDIEAVRRRIFTGHPGGMPSWGITGVAPRDIDAAAFFIVERLLPEATGGAAEDTLVQP